MRQISLIAALVMTAALVLQAPAEAADEFNFTVALQLGLGGTSDANPDPGLDNLGFQGLFKMATSRGVSFAARIGRFDLEADSSGVLDTQLSYITVGGEYTDIDTFFESSLFIGLGAYDVSGNFFVPDETGVGLVLGVGGDFRINNRWSVLGELAGHLTDLEYAGIFITANFGLGYHF